MNDNLKNIFSFMKDALELKNKNICNVDNYEVHLDLGKFCQDFRIKYDYSNIDINSDGIIFQLKYIDDKNKGKIPSVPENLKEYISLDKNNNIVANIDDLEKTLLEKGLLDFFKKYEVQVEEIKKYNSLIDSYNKEYMKFYNIYKRIVDYEEKIEVVFAKKLLVWMNEKDIDIKRYILEADLEMTIDSVNNIINFKINKDKFRGLVTDFLNYNTYSIKDISNLNKYVKEFNNNIDNEDINWNDCFNNYINYASLNNEIVERDYKNDLLKEQITYLFNNCAIIVRKKNIKLWIEDLEKIISLCDNNSFQNPILNLFQIDFNNTEGVLELLNDKSYELTKNDEVLFPLPANEEQYKIVDKVKNSNIVLVKGPPGTGKSHTIANLLSHYISEGKKVIVTSEKAKALEVLRDKIPENIRSLSLSLLESNGVDKELEYSIQNVLKHEVDDNELVLIEQEINKLKTDLEEIKVQKQGVMKKIIEIMAKDTVSHKEELNAIINYESTNELTLMDIASWLSENKKYKIVPISDNENYLYNNPNELFLKLDDISEEIKNKGYVISTKVPVSDYLINNEVELYIKERISYQRYQIKNPNLMSAIKQNGLNEEVIDKLEKEIESLDILYNYFSKEEIKLKILHEPFINKIKEIIELININKNYFVIIEEKLYDYNISFTDESKKNDYLKIVNEILKLYDANGNIHLLNKLKFNSYFIELKGLIYNNKEVSKDDITKNDLIKIKEALDYYIIIDIIKVKLNQVLNIDLFEQMHIPKNQFSSYSDKIINILNAFSNFNGYVKEIDTCFNRVINSNLFPISYLNSSNDYIKSVLQDLKYFINEKLTFNKGNLIANEVRNYYKDYNLQNLQNLLNSIIENNLEKYGESKNLLLREINIINQYNNLKDIYPELFREKSNLIRSYIYDFSINEREFFKTNISFIFKYHYLEKYYLFIENKDVSLSELYNERERLIIKERKVIASLVEKKGWYYQNKKMTPGISSSLSKWVNLRKKLGGGTGKNANIYLRQMREEMQTAKNAIPVWIMPIDKLIEQYPFSINPPFDVLIMDESSQTSVFSLSALTRAKKIIIVGDDKQISPTNAFTNLDDINALRAKYLKNNKWNLQFARDTSIYDIIQDVCGSKKITLTEHFRCLPEIIHYSNKEFYNMEINPLKVRGKENTIEKPIKTIYVSNAVCKKNGVQVYNQKEIDTIISLIEEISNDKQYDNKTIGIIALQNGSKNYIQKLTELIMQKFGEKFINERDIKIGTTYDFQGDERDVIILGMVVSSVLEDGSQYSFRALTTEEFNKSYNVAASRAKEQMILVHSVTLQELSPSCNRFKLLNYCLNYDKEPAKEYEKLFESKFEKDFYDYLSPKYNLIPQFKVGKYRIDFVLNDNNQKIAIECDGDKYHGIEELQADLERQSILERCGWKFVRIRASEFYYDREKSMNNLIESIENYLDGNNMTSYSNQNTNTLITNDYSTELEKDKSIEELMGFENDNSLIENLED